MFLYWLSTLPYDFEDWESLIEVELVHKDKTQNRFLEKEQKREQTKENQLSIVFMTSFYCLKAYKWEELKSSSM